MRDGFYLLRVIPCPVVMQPPRRCISRLALLYAHDDVAVPRPGVLAIKLTRPRGRIGMGMIPPDQLDALLACGFFRQADVIRSYFEPVSRRIVPPVCERHQVEHLTRFVAIAAQQRPATFMWIRFRSVRVDALHNFVVNFQRSAAHSSLQNRSLKYFSPESGNTVTISAGSCGGKRRATSRHAQSAPPALTPTRIPSSRASFFATRCASSVRTSMFSSARLAS